LCTLKSGLFLQIDVCSRVFRSFNFLEELMNQKNKDFKDSLLDQPSSPITAAGGPLEFSGSAKI
jgi:hypothetical protein